MTVTSHDVARLAGVSQPTVSRALRGDTRVAEATRQRIQAAAAQLGYVASELGRNLSTRSTRQIAMVADLRNELYPTLVAPLHDRLAEHGYRMMLLAERGDDTAAFERLLDRSVDGAILTTTTLRSSLSQELARRHLPFVELNRISGRRGVDGVTADNVGGARSVARLFAERGHRRVAAVFGARTTSTGRDREDGFRHGLAEAGIELPDRWVTHGGFGHDDGERGFARVMTGRHRPTAVFCVGDAVAVGALNEARRQGLSVPDDVSVVGFDDLAIASWPVIRLTSVRVDFTAMAAAAADQLVRRL
ncbi:MAG: LacI family DNA-binding transcriptional regulator, partial [Jatrophihabitans sp.]|uniref:LacI family DNA-binding transcriptional regulator n=1 Tax=Jatrophihabitans sp. TaxID=1932789 RepID=UPI003F816766